MSDWQPQLYLEFADERNRPARDLLAQVPLVSPRVVYDLGCGPGNSTALLVERFPGARVIGIDNSPAMFEAAHKACPMVEFRQADLTAWQPDEKPDLLYSNATFQWVPNHLDVLKRLAEDLKPGAAMAVQMPDNLAEASHLLMQQVAEQGPWAAKLSRAGEARQALPGASVYHERLKPIFSRFEIWQSVYHHALPGTAGIASFLKSTGLRPYLDPLEAGEQAEFLARYEAGLADAYPALADGQVLLRFPRLFFVGLR